MVKTVLVVAGLVVALFTATASPSQTIFRPIAVVNDSAITGYDLSQRAQILVALGFNATDAEALRVESLERLVEDRLKFQEASRQNLTANDESIKAGIEEFAGRSGITADEFRAKMTSRGVTEQALNDLVAAEIVWRQVVRGRFARRVEPGEADIDAEIALMQERTGASYRIAEIGLPINDRGRSNAETQELAEKIYASLNQGGDFDAAVRNYSRAPSAARGGEVGWVSSARLPPELAEMLAEMEDGQVSRPFQVSGGFSILKLLEKRIDSASAIDPNDLELRNQVRDRLASQRTARLAEGLLQELRRDALIELR
jgi:peptidyl-prolyl cis-trans isomerase SurA